MGGGFSAGPASIDGSAHLLVEIAGLLHEGRLDGDIGTMARVPRTHPEVGAKVEEFARFADDQYQDLMLLLTALSTKLRATGNAYVQVDGRVQEDLDNILTEAARRAAESPWNPVTPRYLPGPLAGDKDATSFGPMAVQIRRAAEVLGYDPEHLSEQQRNEVRSALKDPAQNLFIASKYLTNVKAESEFANVPADQMTPAQYRELAARYNGGPNWQGAHAQDYGRGFETSLGQAREALR